MPTLKHVFQFHYVYNRPKDEVAYYIEHVQGSISIEYLWLEYSV